MNRRLCISVTLLDALFHGKGDRDSAHPDGRPEWPPSPMRLFQALLRGSRTGCHDRKWSTDKANAFCWLERRSPPIIVAPEGKPTSTYTLFVPNNDSDEKFDRQDRLTSKIVRPHRLPGVDGPADKLPTLYYLWQIPENEWLAARPHVELLKRESHHLMALGWGIDQAVGDGAILNEVEASGLAGKRWQPWLAAFQGRTRLRVPKKGSLEDLGRAHVSSLDRVRIVDRGRRATLEYEPVYKARCFDSVVYLPLGVLPCRQYAVFELPEGVAFRQEAANEVAAMMRSLACDDKKYHNRQDFQSLFPKDDTAVYLAGHVNNMKQTPPRFSYLPLPTIGSRHSDGMIRRLMIAEPIGGNGRRARWAEQRLCTQVLCDDRQNERGVLMDLCRNTSKTMITRYTKENRAWCTITPMILPGFDDGKHAKGERLFIQALRQADIPIDAVCEFTLRKAPYWPGSKHPGQYHTPAYLKHLPRWHVHVTFRKPIGGPLAIGAGRHLGLGLFAAAELP